MEKSLGFIALLLSVLFVLPILAGCGENGVTADFTVAISSEGKYTSVLYNGTELVSEAGGGFSVYDYAAKESYPAEVTSATHSGGKYTLFAENKDANYTLEAVIENKNGVIYISGTIKDTSGAFRRFRLDHALPINAEGFKWWKDLNNYETVTGDGVFVNHLLSYNDDIYSAAFPLASVSGEKAGVAVATTFEYPVIHDFTYDNSSKTLITSYYMGLSPETKYPSEGSFSFVIYGFGGADGFRGALSKLYGIMPEHYTSRSTDHGNWLFHQNSLYNNDGVEDFLGRYNENGTLPDVKYGAESLNYVAPAEIWIDWKEYSGTSSFPTYRELEARLDEMLSMEEEGRYKGSSLATVARAILNSRLLLNTKKPWTAGWNSAYPNMICYVANGDPDIEGDSCFSILLAYYKWGYNVRLESGLVSYGLYIDNANFGAPTVDYNSANFKYCDWPLLWDTRGKPVMPYGYGVVDFVRGFTEATKDTVRCILGNIAYPEHSATPLAHLFDVPGGEIGNSWGQTENDFIQRRVNAGRKPWALLLTQKFNDVFEGVADDVSPDLYGRELLVKKSLYWGVFANVITLDPKGADEFDAVRGIFTKYMWTVKNVSEAGWEPLTRAVATGLDCERYGGNGDSVWYTVRAGEATEGTVSVDLSAVGFKESDFGSLYAFDSVNNRILPAKLENGRLTVSVSLKDKDDVTAFVICSEESAPKAFENEYKVLYERLERSSADLAEDLKAAGIEASSYIDALSADAASLKAAVEGKDLVKVSEILNKIKSDAAALTENLNVGEAVARTVRIEFTEVAERYVAKTDVLNSMD